MTREQAVCVGCLRGVDRYRWRSMRREWHTTNEALGAVAATARMDEAMARAVGATVARR
jgi:hypothetical protein